MVRSTLSGANSPYTMAETIIGNVCEQKAEDKRKLAARVYGLQEASPEFMLNKQNKSDTLYHMCGWTDSLN